MKSVKNFLSLLMGGLFMNHAAVALTVGDRVPDISVPSTGGAPVNLRTGGGAWRVVYFYPKSFTPGCTKQACGLRDSRSAYAELGAVVYGVSTDALAKQHEFKAKYALPFDLLADHEKKLSRAFDALGIAGFSKRMTFIVNPEGVITDVVDSVDVGSHDEDVIAILKTRMAAAKQP